MQTAAVILVLGIGAGAMAGAEIGMVSPNPVDLNNRGAVLARQAKFAEAEECYRRALDIWSHAANPAAVARDRAHTLENLGSLQRDTGQFAEAETSFAEALLQLEESAGKSSRDVGEVLENLGVLYRAKGDRAKAEASALRADTILTEPDRTNNRIFLAAIYTEQRRFAEAHALLDPALPGTPGKQAFAINANLSALALGEGKLTEAEGFAKTAFESAGSNAERYNIGVAALYNNLGQIYRFQHRYEEAESAYRKAIDLWTAARGPKSPLAGNGLLNLAAFEHERGRERAAEDLYRQAAGIFEGALGVRAIETLVARNELAEVLRAEKRYVAAQQLTRATLPELQKKLAENDPRLLRAMNNYARLVSEQGDESSARARH